MKVDLKRIREDFHLSQVDLAGRLGVNVRTLGNYERTGKVPLSMQKLIRYEFYYGEKSSNEEMVKLKQENGYLKRLTSLYEERIRFLEEQLKQKQ